jgi:8-oxo-dGTP pyrophosphatase MutT (NUDIX family)
VSESVANGQTRTPPPQRDLLIRPAVKAFIASADRILLQTERHTDGTLFWTLPGGGIEGRETATGALRRELVEELQTTPLVKSELGWVPYAHSGASQTVSVYRVFDCALLEEPQANSREGVYTCRWVDPEKPPTRTLPQVKWLLRRYATEQ